MKKIYGFRTKQKHLYVLSAVLATIILPSKA
jgi:hypothetical protein